MYELQTRALAASLYGTLSNTAQVAKAMVREEGAEAVGEVAEVEEADVGTRCTLRIIDALHKDLMEDTRMKLA